MKSFTRKLIVLALTITSVLVSSLAMAAAINNVANTKHNLAVGGPGMIVTTASGVNQICIFCHTPHNALKTGPLWNKTALNAATTFKMYTSSKSLSSAAKLSSLSANSPSLLCLSCHDGKTAMNILHNTSYGKTVAAAAGGLELLYPVADMVLPTTNGVNAAYLMNAPVADMFGDNLTPDNRVGFGDNLTDDHPIGFSYSAAYTEKIATNSLKNYAGMDSAVRFFGTSKKIECSTCHNPHLDSNGDVGFDPFLVKSNADSALCLTCHNK